MPGAQRNFASYVWEFQAYWALCCHFKYMTFNWRQNQTFKATYTWAVDNWRPNDCEAEDGSVISRMVSGAKPQQNFCLRLCLRISSILGHFVVNSNIWLLIDVKIKPSKLLKLQQYTNEHQRTVWLRTVISRIVSGAEPQQNFWLLCLRILSKVKHFLVWCLTFKCCQNRIFEAT